MAPILRKTRARSLNLAGWSSMSGLLSETGETNSGPARTVAASSDRKAEGHTEADFAKRLVVELRAAQADVEGDVVAHLPDRANQRRPCRQANEIPLVEDLRDGSQRPVMRAFDDHPEERIRGLLSGDGDGGVEMDGQPRPLLRHDSRDAAAGSTARIVIDAGQQEAEFSGDARTRLALQAAFAQHRLEEQAIADQARLAGVLHQRVHRLALQHELPSRCNPVVEDHGRGHERAFGSYLEVLRGSQFDLDLTELGNGGVGAVKRAVGLGVATPGHGQDRRQHETGIALAASHDGGRNTQIAAGSEAVARTPR